jgi:hypothetical protein
MTRNSTDDDGETRTQLTSLAKRNGSQRENGAIRNGDSAKCRERKKKTQGCGKKNEREMKRKKEERENIAV